MTPALIGGGYPSGNNSGCSSNITSLQDCHQGRDATHDDDSDGHAGFSFTKIDGGNCVQDNVTGLMWEVKTDDGLLHDKDDTYNWYNTDGTANGGADGYADDDGAICYGYDSGDSTSFCNTEAYVSRVNAAGWCGYNDWRLPDREALRSIVDASRTNPSIDADYFPNTESLSFWSASPNAGYSNYAWVIYFDYGYGYSSSRNGGSHVRLVRGGQ